MNRAIKISPNISSIFSKYHGKKISECIIIYTNNYDDPCVYYANENGSGCANIITGDLLDSTDRFLLGLKLEIDGPENTIIPMADDDKSLNFDNYLSSIPNFIGKTGSNVITNNENVLHIGDKMRTFKLEYIKDSIVSLNYSDNSFGIMAQSIISFNSQTNLQTNTLFLKMSDVDGYTMPDVIQQTIGYQLKE